MKPNPYSILIAAFLFTSAYLIQEAPAKQAPPAPERDSKKDARLGWWREARFGMFVHWGPSAYLGGTWRGKAFGGYAEHIQRALKIPMSEYRTEVIEKFNPVKFDADEWMRLAKEAGVGYFIITAKHHDGFAMYDSKVSDYNVVKASPFARDPMKELRAAATKYGIKFGFYYSHAFDWGDANAPGNDWEYRNPGGDKLLHGANWWETYPEFLPNVRKYVDQKAIPQIRELIADYNPDILWFDTPHKLPREENLRILAAVRQADPKIVVNGRILASHQDNLSLVDYVNTADRPAEFTRTEGDWEGVPTTNEAYGYNQNDNSYKPTAHFIRLLAKAAARGGNVLLNMGPRGDGTLNPKEKTIFEGIGAWWKVNGDSICGTTRPPLAVQAWGESTRKGNRLYLHVFDWPADGNLVVGGLTTEVTHAYLMLTPGKLLETKRTGSDVAIAVGPVAPDPTDSVVVVECAGEPKADPVRLLSSAVPADTLRGFDGLISGGLHFGPGKKTDDVVLNWTNTKCSLVWPVRLNEKATFELEINYDAPGDTKSGKTAEGDAGAEFIQAQKGAAGTYVVTINGQEFFKQVRHGKAVKEALGKVTLEPGSYEIRVAAKEITGSELFRLRNLKLLPVRN